METTEEDENYFEEEELILLEIYDKMGGVWWKQPINWMDTEFQNDHCNWTGIVCDPFSRISQIYLENKNISGSLPESFYELEYLEGIFLSNTEIGWDEVRMPHANRISPLADTVS